jgi:GNAT superfamily N-acetyltransferase
MDLGNLQTIGGRADFGDREDLKEEWERRQNKYKKGGRTISQTPAPKKDQIKGSDKNKAGSSKDTESAKQIKFNEKTLNSIQNKVDEHNKQYPNKKITLESAKAVVRRGMGAYSQTYRPTISGGKPNSRVAWGLARLNAFIYKIINGKSKSGKYSQDNDLIEELGYKVQKYSAGGDVNNFVLYHGTGNAKKVLEALKNNSFIFHKSAGVENGIYLTDNKSTALDYANYTKGDDIGVLEIRFKKIPNFKKYNNAGDKYDDETKYSRNPKEASIEYRKDLMSNNYDGYITGEVFLLFKEKIDLIDFDKTKILNDVLKNKSNIRFDEGGETKKIKFDIEEDDEEQRITISIKNIGEVILVVSYPEYEFLEDIGEDGLEELGVEEGDMIGKIEHLEIEDKYKGQGYAKLLMNKAIEIAKEKGLMPLYLNASPMGSDGLDIDALTIFYEKLGFQVFFEQGRNNLMILKESYNNGGLMKRRSRKRNQ